MWRWRQRLDKEPQSKCVVRGRWESLLYPGGLSGKPITLWLMGEDLISELEVIRTKRKGKELSLLSKSREMWRF